MSRYSLIDEKWIPVRFPDGTRGELGIRDTCYNPERLRPSRTHHRWWWPACTGFCSRCFTAPWKNQPTLIRPRLSSIQDSQAKKSRPTWRMA